RTISSWRSTSRAERSLCQRSLVNQKGERVVIGGRYGSPTSPSNRATAWGKVACPRLHRAPTVRCAATAAALSIDLARLAALQTTDPRGDFRQLAATLINS